MWTLNNIQITVVGLKEESTQNIVELQPLDGGTVYQYFGYVNDKFPLECLIVGSGDKSAVAALANTGLAYPLLWDTTDFGDFYVNKATFMWMTSYAQSFRPDKPREDLVFRCTLDLSKA